MDLNELLYGFCGNETVLNSSLLYEQLPVLTSCFLDTLPVWISCGYLWIASIPYLVFLIRSRRKPLPFSYLHLVKMVLAVGLLCFADLHYSFRQMTGETCAGMEVVPTAGQVSMGLKFATFLLAAVLLQMQKRHGAVTSGVTFFFWGLTMTAETCRLYVYVIGQVQCRTQVIFYVYYGGIWTQLILHCFADKREIVQKSSDKREILQKSSDKRETVKVPCPQDQASNLNRITYSWMSSLVYRIYRNTFKRESMWQQTENLKSSVIGPRLEKRWKHNQHTAKQREKHLIQMSPCQPETTFDDQLSVSITSETTPLIPSKHQPQNVTSCPQRLNASLMKTLWREYCWDFLTIFTLSWISVALFFIQPVLLRFLIEYIDTRSSSAATNPLWQGVFFAVAMVIVMEFSSMFYNSQCHHTTSLGLRMKHSLMYLIYKKALTVCKSENKISVGEVVNMMSVDCIRIQDAIYFFYYGPNCFIFVAGASYLLYTTVGGVATLGGMVVMFLIIPLNGFIVRSQNIIQQELLYLKGLRLRLMNEILCGIKVLKMYAWEFAFVRKVEDIREKEVKLLKRNATLMAIGTAVAYHSTYVVHFFLILIYVLLKEDRYVDSSTVFVSLSVVVILKYPLTVLPTMLNGCVQIVVVESSSRFGGWMRTLTDEDGAKMELGPRSIRPAGAAGYNTLCLAEELGLEADIVKVSRGEPAAQNRFVFANGKLNKLPNKAASFFTKQAPFSKPLYRYGIHDILADAGLLEDESVYDFMSRRFDEDLARYAVDPMCRGIFAGDCRKLSVKSALPMLYEAERLRGSVILGMLKKSRSGYPKQRECKLQERCRQEQWTTYSFKQGLQHLSDTVKDFISSSPQIELVNNTLCDRVSFQDGKASVHVNGEIIAADHVFSSIYAADLAKLISPEYPSIAEDLEKIPAVHTVVVCVEFDGHVDPPTPGFGHLTPSFEDKAVLGVIYDSCTFPQHDRTDKLSARYTVMMGGSWYADLQHCVPSMTDADLGQYAVKALQAQLGTSETPVKVHVEQLHNCIPQYVLGHSKVLERLFSQTQQLPLSLVGSSYRGPAVNDCINNARLEVERLTGQQLQ